MNAIEVRSLTRHFGNFVAVGNVSFDVRAGEIFGFLGSNGAGKSTTIRMLCGLLRPTSGAARVGGIDVLGDPEGVKRQIGYMSQRFSEVRATDAVRAMRALDAMPEVEKTSIFGTAVHAVLRSNATPAPVLAERLQTQGIAVLACDVVAASLEDVFLDVAERSVA